MLVNPPDDSVNQTTTYFTSEEVLFLVAHDEPLAPGDVIAQLREIPALAEMERFSEIEFDPERVVTFERFPVYDEPMQQKQALMHRRIRRAEESERGPANFSIVVGQIGMRDDELIGLVDALDQAVMQPDQRSTYDDRRPRRRRRRARGQAVIPRAVTFNWLSGAADPSHLGTGGPGARPVPAKIAPKWYTSAADAPGAPYGFSLPHLPHFEDPHGDGVEVAILDTAPSPRALQEAFKRWQEKHPLIRSLLGPGGTLPSACLRVSYASGECIKRLHVPKTGKGGYGLRKHAYEMADHGLFSAGIIHSIVPYASLFMIQVLNDYGVGSIETIARGLQTLARERDRSKRLVINLSLMLGIPQAGEPLEGYEGVRLFSDCAFLERSAWPVEWICDMLYDQDVLVVAAAGNDAQAGRRPQARYPAAFDKIVGVGALSKNGKPAGYSNLADRPSRIGIATFGGDSTSDGKADENDGILGIYTGRFPDGAPNRSGWARWAGTSFATPVISGVLALLRSQVYTPEDAIRKVYESQPEVTPSPGDEEVFSSVQGN